MCLGVTLAKQCNIDTQMQNEVYEDAFEALWHACGKERPENFSVV